jgi:hypothetical protein
MSPEVNYRSGSILPRGLLIPQATSAKTQPAGPNPFLKGESCHACPLRLSELKALPFIVSMNPPGYPSASLRPRRARFFFARQDDCSFTTSMRLDFRMGRKPLGMLRAST